MDKKRLLLLLISAFTLSACGKAVTPTPVDPGKPDPVDPADPVEPEKENAVLQISEELEYTITIEDGLITLMAYTPYEIGTHTLYYCLNKNRGMDENNVFKITYSIENGKVAFYTYNGADYYSSSQSSIYVDTYYDEKSDYFVTEFNIFCNEDEKDLLDNFSFYPEYYDSLITINYTMVWEYMRNNYPQTWFSYNEKGEFYYDESFETFEVENWTRPSFKDKEGSHLAYSCSETSIEGARVSAMCAERMGATAFDLHIESFYSRGLLTAENIERITKAVHIPVLAIFYDGGQSQQTRLDGLKVAVEGGAAAVDLQGFMYWTGSTLNTQTPDNIAYWEAKGFDMSFVSAHPVETILDIDGINKQKAYIQDIHDMGAEVLLSSHNQAVYTKKQAIAYAKFIEDRGVDVIKLVGYGNNTDDLYECIEANKVMSEMVSCKFSFHLQTNDYMRITRVVCPLYYGAFLAFCYYNMTHLNMMVDLSSGDIPSKDTPLDEVVEYMEQHTTHSELKTVISLYRACPEPSEYFVHAYGQSSEMSHKWDCGEGYSHIALREETSSNSFNIRAYAYRKNHKGSKFSYSCSISGLFYPYVSSSRNPKVGIMLGDENNMLAFVYETNTKTVDLMHNDTIFAYDEPKSDRLYTIDKFASPTYTTEVNNKGTVNMGIYADDENLKLYFSEGDAELTLLATLDMGELKPYIGGDGNVGSVLELYLGSASANKTNYLHFDNIVFSKNTNIFES